jgi:hypothetical protein
LCNAKTGGVLSSIHETETGVKAAYIQNQKGDVCIAFDDPAYVQSDTVLIGADGLSIHVILHEKALWLGAISPEMAAAFKGRKSALLTAVRPDGSIFELTAPIAHE